MSYKLHTIKCINANIPELITTIDNIKLQLPRYYTKKLGINIDTEKFRIQAIEKNIKFTDQLKQHNITPDQFKKQYHKLLWQLKKEHHYDNELITNLPQTAILDYNK